MSRLIFPLEWKHLAPARTQFACFCPAGATSCLSWTWVLFWHYLRMFGSLSLVFFEDGVVLVMLFVRWHEIDWISVNVSAMCQLSPNWQSLLKLSLCFQKFLNLWSVSSTGGGWDIEKGQRGKEEGKRCEGGGRENEGGGRKDEEGGQGWKTTPSPWQETEEAWPLLPLPPSSWHRTPRGTPSTLGARDTCGGGGSVLNWHTPSIRY